MVSSQCLCSSVASYLLPIVVASFVFYFLLIYLSVSVSSADFNIKSPSSNPTCKNYQHQVRLCHPPPFMQKLPKGLNVIEKPRAGLDLDGGFPYSCLVCCYCCFVALSRYDAQSQYGLTSS